MRLNELNLPDRTVLPTVPITDSKFKYVPASKTDVQNTWARFGWTPPSRKEAAHEQHA